MPSHTPLHHIMKGVFTAVSFTKYIMSSFQGKRKITGVYQLEEESWTAVGKWKCFYRSQGIVTGPSSETQFPLNSAFLVTHAV